tara:strand:+ start:30479 stop:30625 length:147 start_codon:yes stop_codon:yes gene_type:complete
MACLKISFAPENEKISFINKNLILTTIKIEIGKYKNGIFSNELEIVLS